MTRKKRPNRNPTQKHRDRMMIAEMYCRGVYQTQIARELDLARTTVTADLKVVRAIWRDRAVASFDQHVANELAKIDNLERTYWEAWEKSQRPRKSKEKASSHISRNEEGRIGAQSESASTEVEPERDGNPNFLMGVERCIKQRIDLLGLKAPDMWERADWQREMQEAGIDATELFEKAVQVYQNKRERELVEVLSDD